MKLYIVLDSVSHHHLQPLSQSLQHGLGLSSQSAVDLPLELAAPPRQRRSANALCPNEQGLGRQDHPCSLSRVRGEAQLVVLHRFGPNAAGVRNDKEAHGVGIEFPDDQASLCSGAKVIHGAIHRQQDQREEVEKP